MMLSIIRPTPTTVLYTVSTRSPSQTLTARASTYALLLARIIAGTCVAVVLLNEYRIALPRTTRDHAGYGITATLDKLLSMPPLGPFLAALTAHNTRIYRLIISSGVVRLILRKSYTSESLLVIRGLGVQTSTSSPSYLWASSTRFIPTSSIQDIFIHEAFKGFEVRFYLSIVVEGEEDVVVVFPVRTPHS